jgi:hypothetical protein
MWFFATIQSKNDLFFLRFRVFLDEQTETQQNSRALHSVLNAG